MVGLIVKSLINHISYHFKPEELHFDTNIAEIRTMLFDYSNYDVAFANLLLYSQENRRMNLFRPV